MRIKKLLPHARQRLHERFGLKDLPQKKPVFIISQSANRKIYRIGEIYFVWRKSDKTVVTVLLKEDVLASIRHHKRRGKHLKMVDYEKEVV